MRANVDAKKIISVSRLSRRAPLRSGGGCCIRLFGRPEPNFIAAVVFIIVVCVCVCVCVVYTYARGIDKLYRFSTVETSEIQI